MADYRLSAQMIGRSQGRSSVAAAAYRAGENLHDERTGLEHDYTRKEGILHTEIMAPADAPEWMQNRAELWNAVEAVETRKNSQMSREVQLSLPHELDFEANRELVRDFVSEQFVAKGMIADVAIHTPSRAGDERNIHAHVMLTTRTLTDDGFGKKNRDWGERAQLEDWREQWAHHQNRALARAGESGRVDHRSYERQGLDRQPTVHMGPHATEMHRMGIQTDLGSANDNARARNALQAQVERNGPVLDAKKVFEQRKFESWADRRRGALQEDQATREARRLTEAKAQMQALEARLKATTGQERQYLQQTAGEASQRLEAKGFRKVVRDVFGRTKRDQALLQVAQAQQSDLRRREVAEKSSLRETIQAQRTAEREARRVEALKLERGIQRARVRREGQDWEGQAQAYRSRRQQVNEAAPKERIRPETGPKIDPRDKRAKMALTDRASKLSSFYQKLELSRGNMSPTPDKPGPARDFARARKNERDRDPER